MTPMDEIKAERQRQIEIEGYTASHDDGHQEGEILIAAVLYYQSGKGVPIKMRSDGAPLGWPWEAEFWKPKSVRRDLVRAGALCLAERERLRRIRGSYRGHVDQKLRLIIRALEDVNASA